MEEEERVERSRGGGAGAGGRGLGLVGDELGLDGGVREAAGWEGEGRCASEDRGSGGSILCKAPAVAKKEGGSRVD